MKILCPRCATEFRGTPKKAKGWLQNHLWGPMHRVSVMESHEIAAQQFNEQRKIGGTKGKRSTMTAAKEIPDNAERG